MHQIDTVVIVWEMLCLFNHILEDYIFYDALYCKDNIDIDWESVSPAMFHLFDVTGDETSLFDDFDPDVNYYNDVLHYISTESKYLSEDKFRERIQLDTRKQDKPFSLFHLNIRSEKNLLLLKSIYRV